LIHLSQTESHFRSFGLDLDLGAGTHGALVTGDAKLFAIANERDRCLRGRAIRHGGTSGSNGRSVRSKRTERSEQSESSGPGFEIDSGWQLSSAVRKIQAADITRAHSRVPGGTDLT